MPTNLTNNLSLPESWGEDLNKKLNDKTISNEYEDWKLKKNLGTEIDVFALSFNASASAGFQIFNDEKDEDKPAKLIANPYPAIGADKAMIRYDLEASLKAAAEASFENLGFKFDTSQKLKTSYYSIHPNDTTLKDAAVKDLTNFRFIFSADDVKSLEANEIVALSYNGEIAANLELSFSDAFTGTISEVSKRLPKETGLTLKSNAGASISFGIDIKDDFIAYIKKNSDNSFFISINKNSSNEKSVTAKAEINAQLEKNEDFNTFLNALFDSFFNHPVEQLDDIIDNHLSNLNDNYKVLLNELGDRVGIDIDFTEPNLIKQKYDALKEKIEAEVSKVLDKKLNIAFSLEYKKITSTNTLFEAQATSQGIDQHLRSIVMFKPSALENAGGIKVTKYLLTKTSTSSSKIGMALQFGDFKLAWQQFKSAKEETKKDRVANTQDIDLSFLREHTYSGVNNRKWGLVMTASTPAPVASPRMNDFDFDLTLHWEDRQRKTNAEELSEFVNMASIWKCIPEKAFKKVRQEIADTTGNQHDLKYSCHLNAPLGVLDDLFKGISEASNFLISNSLAEAMPFAEYAYRKTPSLRKIAYNSFWQTYLTDAPVDIRKFAGLFDNYLTQDDALALWEAQYKSGPMTRDNGATSFVGLIEFFSVNEIVKNIQEGFGDLDKMIQKNKPYDFRRIKNNFEDINSILSYKGANDVYFHINFFARLILNVATNLGLHNKIESFAAVEYNEGNEQKKLIYSSKK